MPVDPVAEEGAQRLELAGRDLVVEVGETPALASSQTWAAITLPSEYVGK